MFSATGTTSSIFFSHRLVVFMSFSSNSGANLHEKVAEPLLLVARRLAYGGYYFL